MSSPHLARPGIYCPKCQALIKRTRLAIQKETDATEPDQSWSVCLNCSAILRVLPDETRRIPTASEVALLGEQHPDFWLGIVGMAALASFERTLERAARN